MFENYLILFVSVSYLYIFGNGSWTASMFSQSDEMSIIYPEYSKIQIWNGRTTFIYIFRPFPIPILSAFLSYYIKYMFETLKLSVLFQIANIMWLSNLCLWNKVVETKPSSKWNNDNLLGSTPGSACISSGQKSIRKGAKNKRQWPSQINLQKWRRRTAQII